MRNKKETKASMEVLNHYNQLRHDNSAGRLGNEGGNEKKESMNLKVGTERSPEMAEDKNPGHVKSGSHLDHPRVKAIKQHKLVNDTAYFLHHPQIKPHGEKMPPKKPRGC